MIPADRDKRIEEIRERLTERTSRVTIWQPGEGDIRFLLAALDEERERADFLQHVTEEQDAAVRRAVDEQLEAQDRAGKAEQMLTQARKLLTAAEARASSWQREAERLAEFAVHRYGCMAAPALTGGGPVDAPQECTCGLDEALSKFRERKKEQTESGGNAVAREKGKQ